MREFVSQRTLTLQFNRGWQLELQIESAVHSIMKQAPHWNLLSLTEDLISNLVLSIKFATRLPMSYFFLFPYSRYMFKELQIHLVIKRYICHLQILNCKIIWVRQCALILGGIL